MSIDTHNWSYVNFTRSQVPLHVCGQPTMATLPPERPDTMALMKNEPSKFRVSELVAVEPLVSVKSELNAADTWFRICAADVLWNRER